MNKLLIGSKNQGKFQEISSILEEFPYELVSLRNAFLEAEEIEEDGITYKENAIKKAQFYAKMSNLPTIADDGGLEIEALGGAPGVRSHRWLGHASTDEELVAYMMHIAKTLPENNRRAAFKIVVAFSLPNGQTWTTEGQTDGVIAQSPHPSLLKGFPYRSYFYLPTVKKYFHDSELTKEEMRRYNHRYLALQRLRPILLREMQSIVL